MKSKSKEPYYDGTGKQGTILRPELEINLFFFRSLAEVNDLDERKSIADFCDLLRTEEK